ncbi:MAG: thlA, partial [Rhodospirillales bacterium]|nr:thlA [Rhodospirillales bacterium]
MICETVARSGIDPVLVESVVMGNVLQAGNRMNPARQAAINGGIPVAVPALTVNRVCGSGAQAIASAAQEVLLGDIRLAVAGGMENMDRAPYLMDGGRWGYRMGPAEIETTWALILASGLHVAAKAPLLPRRRPWYRPHERRTQHQAPRAAMNLDAAAVEEQPVRSILGACQRTEDAFPDAAFRPADEPVV